MLNYSKGTSLGEKKACIIVSFPINKVQRPQRRHCEKFFIGLYVDHLPFLDSTSSPLAEGPEDDDRLYLH